MAQSSFGMSKRSTRAKRKQQRRDGKAGSSSSTRTHAPKTAAEKRAQRQRRSAQQESRGERKGLRKAKQALEARSNQRDTGPQREADLAELKAKVKEKREATKGIRTARKKTEQMGIRPTPGKGSSKRGSKKMSGTLAAKPSSTTVGTPPVVVPKPKPAKPVSGYSPRAGKNGQKVNRGRSSVPGGTDGAYSAPRIAGTGKKRRK